ncbi:hypothetical protein CCHR01_16843 [Colletotrichum chrysophilum]|uniref:Uncharacterized protein n=1 Tax=Colletotrichum chrysophilum TaxID=1836956 RepID=A0AAD9A355_9PEZI|nr:hypothetical protein CCHR01_16843 [Colletotrichum chrysophilum]
MSVGSIVTQPTTGGDEGDRSGATEGNGNNNHNRNLTRASRDMAPSDLRNKDCMSYQDAIPSLESSTAAQLIAGNYQLSQGPQTSLVAASSSEVDPNTLASQDQAAEYSQTGDSDDNNDGDDNNDSDDNDDGDNNNDSDDKEGPSDPAANILQPSLP